MLRLNSRTRRLAAALSALAGYVDAVGFLSLGGFFVSFMSGNSTRLAVAAAGRSADAVRASGLIGLFVLGVAAGGGLPVGLTYMTGTLVKMGQQIGSITSRNEMWQWWPYAAHWLALLVGALGGAAAFKLWGSAALWPAVTAAGLLALMTRRSTPDLIP